MNSWFDIKDMDISKMNTENINEIIGFKDLTESAEHI